MSEKTRKYAIVEASKLHLSKVLPLREYNEELKKIIRSEGIQQPIIVRPSTWKADEYEIIDGHLRYCAATENHLVSIEIREGVDDLEVFRISEATFTRKGRTTYERAMHYTTWVRAMKAAYGEEGAQARVAKAAHLSEADISYYISIGEMFQRLMTSSVSVPVFKALKSQPVNKLYEISKIEKGEVLTVVAGRLANSPEMTMKQLRSVILSEIEAADPLHQIAEEEYGKTEAEIEASKTNALKEATQQLEDTLELTRKTVAVLKSNVHSNARSYLNPEALKRIEKMINALRRIGKEAESIANIPPA